MRTVKIDKEEFEVRGLTFSEMRQLHEKGISFGELTPEKVDASFIETSKMIFDEDDLSRFDKVDYGKAANKIVRAVMAETYGSKDEEKNSSRSGDGGQTAKE